MLMEQNEKGRDTIWSVVMAVTTVLILLIGIFFLTKLFTANPLEGTWSDTENGMVLHIKSDGVMEITQALEAETVTIPVEYSMDRNTKRFAVHIKDEELEKAAEEIKNSEADLIVLDCIGYTQEMKKMFAEKTGKKVVLPRTLLARVVSEDRKSVV